MRWEQSRGPSNYAACLDTCQLIVESIMMCTNNTSFWVHCVCFLQSISGLNQDLICYEEPEEVCVLTGRSNCSNCHCHTNSHNCHPALSTVDAPDESRRWQARARQQKHLETLQRHLNSLYLSKASNCHTSESYQTCRPVSDIKRTFITSLMSCQKVNVKVSLQDT